MQIHSHVCEKKQIFSKEKIEGESASCVGLTHQVSHGFTVMSFTANKCKNKSTVTDVSNFNVVSKSGQSCHLWRNALHFSSKFGIESTSIMISSLQWEKHWYYPELDARVAGTDPADEIWINHELIILHIYLCVYIYIHISKYSHCFGAQELFEFLNPLEF